MGAGALRAPPRRVTVRWFGGSAGWLRVTAALLGPVEVGAKDTGKEAWEPAGIELELAPSEKPCAEPFELREAFTVADVVP
jgi:hypothetical protein